MSWKMFKILDSTWKYRRSSKVFRNIKKCDISGIPDSKAQIFQNFEYYLEMSQK